MMDNNIAIKVENVSKKFCKTLKRSMLYGVMDIGRNMCGLISHSDKLRKDEFWAVKDVSFELKIGESIGLIGPNGSGKTTLLKLLNGIFWPDKGKISVKGKVGALIAVGAGFHPQLTGRENIFVNGAILGMGKRELYKKFDSIVAFADIGDFLDTPVKYYSSGMFVRLGFAIAVHCEPDILLVDEVLAVGDISFQARCMERLKDLRATDTSIIFVSHNMSAIQSVCNRAIFINGGEVVINSETEKVIMKYEDTAIKNSSKLKNFNLDSIAGSPVRIMNIKLLDTERKERDTFCTGEKMIIQVEFIAEKCIPNPIFSVGIDSFDTPNLGSTSTMLDGHSIDSIEGRGIYEYHLNKVNFNPDIYKIAVGIWGENMMIHHAGRSLYKQFKVISSKYISKRRYGIFSLDGHWEYKPVGVETSTNKFL